MSKISYPQFVKDIADTYREATGTSEPVAVGEFTNKLTEVLSATGIIYKTITYNEDGSITLIDNNDIQHTINCVYNGSKLSCIKYDGRIINLKYDGDTLTHINNKQINFDFAPIFDTGSGESAVYKLITYNADDTVTLVDDKDVEHIMTCKYEDAKITSVILNEEEIALNYNGNNLTSVESMNIDFIEKSIPVNSEVVATSSGEILYQWRETSEYIQKVNDGLCLCGIMIFKYDGKEFATPLTIGETRESALFYHNGVHECFIEEFEYRNKTYYSGTYFIGVNAIKYPHARNQFYPKFINTSDKLYACKQLIDYYYGIKEFQNGLIVGLASKGKVMQKTMSVGTGVAEVILPVNAEPVIVEINSSNIEIETSVVIESGE